MSDIFLLGTNHRIAPIAVREKFYLSNTEQELLLSELRSDPAVAEAIVLSTCNRTELYLHVISDAFDPAAVYRRLCSIKDIKRFDQFRKHFYQLKDNEAIRHLFEVVSGMDSLILGEKQILGQVKSAVERARKKGMLEKRFNILTNLAIRLGKKAQTETTIGFGGSSVSWAAVAKVEDVLEDLSEKSILLIGAGKMSELAVGQFQNKGFKKLYLINRTEINARDLAGKYGGEVVSFCDIKETLREVDACICSAGAPHYILERSTVEKVMAARRNRPLLLIDISMPRNIEPAVDQVLGVSLYKIDDLEEVVDATMKIRSSAIPVVREFIDAKLSEFETKLSRTLSVPQ